MKIGHYQCICYQKDFEKNLQTVIHGLELATEAGLDIVSFPETFLTGYYSSKEETLTNSFEIDGSQMKKLLEKTTRFEPLYLVGFNELRGDKLYNTVAVIEKGKILGTYSKAFPCAEHFTPGRDFPVFEKNGLKFGVIVCADGGYIEPCRILALKGAKVIFAPHYNFVPDAVEHFQNVRSDHIARAVENSIYFVRGNTVDRNRSVEGLADDGHGYGDSYIINPNGAIVAGAGLYDEYLMIYNLDLKKKHRSGKYNNSYQSADALIDILIETLKGKK